MKKYLLFSILLTIFSFSHTIYVDVEEDKNNKSMINIFTSTDNGETTEGETIYILSDIAYDGEEDVFNEEDGEDYHGKLILFKTTVGKEEKISIPKPAVRRYLVLVYGGIDHVFAKKGISLDEKDVEIWEKSMIENKEKLGKFYELMKKKNF